MLWRVFRAVMEMETATENYLTRDEMERRRLAAAQLLQNGLAQAAVAREFGVSRTTASRWRRALDGNGMEGLRKRRATGRPSRLGTGEFAEIVRIHQAGPRAWGFETDRWTTVRLAAVIEKRFGVHYDPDHVGRLMHRLGLRQREPRVPATPLYMTSLYSPNTVLSRSEISPTVP